MRRLFLPAFLGLTIFLAGCSDDDDNVVNNGEMAEFTVTIENVVIPKPIFQSDVFNIPAGASDPAPLMPGDMYEFDIDAGPVILPMDEGTRLSFVTMFVQSNDLFFAPGEEGIPLYDTSGNPIGANGAVDVTAQVKLWDAGTEVNEETGGPNQKPQQDPMAGDQGIDENGVVTEITNNIDIFGNFIPDVNAVIKVTIENTGPAMFKVRITNVSNDTTIPTPGQGADTTAAVPISPGVYAVHTMPSPFFIEGQAAANAGLVASKEGLENIAEDGFPEVLLMDTQAATGLIVPLSPGAYAIHDVGTSPLYVTNAPDPGDGLEAIAEDGNPMALAATLATNASVTVSAVFNTPSGASAPGPLTPGNFYEFTFEASEGDNLSLATMFVQSNDWFYAFPPSGLPLFNNGVPVTGDVTAQLMLYDSGTEINEYPGAGLFQAIRQPSPDNGPADPNTLIRSINPASQANVPETSAVIRITISVN